MIAVGDRHAGPFERLEQRVREPLGKLVERHPSGGTIATTGVRMTPHVAQRYAVKRVAGRPDRREPILQCVEQIDGGDFVFVIRNQRFEQSAGPRNVIEYFLASDKCRAQATKQRRTPLEPDDRVGCFDLKESRKSRRVDSRKDRGVSA